MVVNKDTGPSNTYQLRNSERREQTVSKHRRLERSSQITVINTEELSPKLESAGGPQTDCRWRWLSKGNMQNDCLAVCVAMVENDAGCLIPFDPKSCLTSQLNHPWHQMWRWMELRLERLMISQIAKTLVLKRTIQTSKLGYGLVLRPSLSDQRARTQILV